MITRITDLWPNLVRRIGGADNDSEGEPLNDQEGSDSEEDLLDVDEDQLLENFKHLYWTRLMVIDQWE